MTTTLTVQEAVEFVLGISDAPDAAEERLRERIPVVREADRDRVVACVEVLAPSGGSEDSDPQVLEALLVCGLAHPDVADEWGIAPGIVARHLGARRDRDGEDEAACGALRVAADHLPGNRAVERALGSLMRRQGMVEDLVERYLARAQGLLEEGRKDEAIQWLREVLLLDRGRKDVARTIRDLQYEEVARKKTGKRRLRVALTVLGLAALVSTLALREMRVREHFSTIDTTTEGELADLRDRLTSLESFISDHPVWHGSFQALSARSALRVEIDRLNTEVLSRREMEAENRRRRQAQADNARTKARQRAEAGQWQEALELMEKALNLAEDDWQHRDRTIRDIEAIREVVQGGQG